MLWELPDPVLFRVVEYVAAPTHRADVVANQIGLLCRDSAKSIFDGGGGGAAATSIPKSSGDKKEEAKGCSGASASSGGGAAAAGGIWEIILKQDYGVLATAPLDDDESSTCSDSGTAAAGRNVGAGTGNTGGRRRTRKRHHSSDTRRRRHSKRLKRSPIDQVKDAHRRVIDNTEIAYFYLSEMVAGNDGSSTTIRIAAANGGGRRRRTTRKKTAGGLTYAKFVGLLNEYGPHLRVNNLTSTGGLFLVEVCRARNVTERTILKCVRELVEHRGALVDATTCESASNSRQTALCVASVRGMPNVVKYLLKKGADVSQKSSGRFRLQTNKHKTLKCVDVTSHEFCSTMIQAETAAGATTQDLKQLHSCAKLLLKAAAAEEQLSTQLRKVL